MTQPTPDNPDIDSLAIAIDETRDRAGNIKPGWQPVLDHWAQQDSKQVAVLQNEISRQLRTNGIAYNAVSNKQIDDRPWQLDLIPLVIEPEDWSALSGGLVQRTQLKKLLLQDLYGEQRVMREGVLPPGVVFSHHGFLRVAQDLPGIDELPIYGIDVSRSPSGDWHVVDDICQVPGGLGYALENRVVLSRALPRLFRKSTVKRLATYFRSLQNYLAQSTAGEERCVILAYGSSHPYYFEYAYLAKYLGYTLVELSDLTVRDERVYLKTVAGLQRVDVILRFILDQDSDPLAVPNSQSIGIPGLLHAMQADNVKIINPLGVGVIENPALNAYLQPLCRYYLGEDVKLLSTPTYWLGDKRHRNIIQARQVDLLYRDVNTIGSLIDPAALSTSAQEELFAKINTLPERYVAQERLDRSNVPCLLGEERSRRQLTLRSYLINDNGDYRVMDGGLCVLDSVSNGGRPPRDLLDGSKDVWVLSNASVTKDTLLLTASESLQISLLEGELPSRVADNLFWLGRYAEKTEQTIRLLSTSLNEYIGDVARANVSTDDEAELPLPLKVLLRTLTEVTGATPGFAGKSGDQRLAKPSREIYEMLVKDDRYGTLANTVASVRRTSNQLRDRLSPELMRVLNDLDDNQKQIQTALAAIPYRDLFIKGDALPILAERFEAMLVTLAAFTGLAQDNLTHGDNWRFIMMGKRIERARQSTGIMRVFMQHERDNTRLMESLLRLFDSTITYRTRYRTRLNSVLVIHSLLLDEVNPRSVAYQFRRIDKDVRQLPGIRSSNYQDPLLRLATAGLSRVRLADIESLLSGVSERETMDKFLGVLERIPSDLTTALTATYFTHSELQRSLIQTSLLQTEYDGTDEIESSADNKSGDLP